jgi:peptide/nickel transport system substrate-binding protein
MGKFDAVAWTNELSRRQVLKLTGLTTAGLAGSVLLAACGGDDEDPTATTASGAATATSSQADPTATDATTEPTATSAPADEPTEVSATSESGADPIDYFGFEIEPAENTDGTAVLLHFGEYNGFNPIVYDGTGYGSFSSPVSLIFESLTQPHPQTGEIVPNLATNWEVADDNLTWTFTLRENITWHDGEPFTAADVAFTYQRLLDPESQSLDHTYYLDLLSSASADGDGVVTLTAARVNSQFLDATLAYIVAEHVIGEVAPADMLTDAVTTGEDPARIVGTGPFTFVDWVVQDHVTVTRYDGYWGGRPNLDSIVFQYSENIDQIEPLLRSGELEYGWATFQSVASLEEAGSVTVHAFPALTLVMATLNLDPDKSPFFHDARVRQALLYGIDREAVVEAAFQGFGQVANTILIPGQWSNDAEGVVNPYRHDPDMASELLDEAGWLMGDAGIRQKDGQVFSITVLSIDYYVPLLTVLQEMWRQLGIVIEIERVPSGTVVEEQLASHDFDMSFWDQVWCGGSGYSGLAWRLLSDNYPDGGNNVKYSNPRVDELFGLIEQELITSL